MVNDLVLSETTAINNMIRSVASQCGPNTHWDGSLTIIEDVDGGTEVRDGLGNVISIVRVSENRILSHKEDDWSWALVHVEIVEDLGQNSENISLKYSPTKTI